MTFWAPKGMDSSTSLTVYHLHHILLVPLDQASSLLTCCCPWSHVKSHQPDCLSELYKDNGRILLIDLYCRDKCHDQKQRGGRKGLLHLVTLSSQWWLPSRKEHTAGTWRKERKRRPWRSAGLESLSLLFYTIQGGTPSSDLGPHTTHQPLRQCLKGLPPGKSEVSITLAVQTHSDERNDKKGKQKTPTISETREGYNWAAESHRQAARELYLWGLKVAGPFYLEGHAKRFLKPTIWKIRARIGHVRHDRNTKLGD